MEPWVVRQGDFLLKLAYKFGFDADTVWNDPANADLRKLRSDPNVLAPTDILYIPEPKPPTPFALTTGTTNTFTSEAPTITLTHRFAGLDAATYASKAYNVEELDHLTELQTDGEGTATFPAPVTLETATITFTETGESFVLDVGAMDPLNTVSGVFKRLQNLGYLAEDDACDVDTVRFGLVAFQAVQSRGGASSSTTSAAASNDPDDPTTQLPDLVDDGVFDKDAVTRVLKDLRQVYGS